MTTEEAYQILDLKGQISAEDVKRAYRRRALEWHPDRYRGDEEKAYYAAKFRGAHEAYLHLRREGFPELKNEPVPEPEFVLRTAGRSFAAHRRDDVPLAEKLGLRVSWNWEAVALWGLLMPGGIIGLVWAARYILRQLNP